MEGRSEWNHNIRFLKALIATNIRASLALRGAFLLQAAFMMANNFIMFTVWWIFFKNFKEVRGWQLADMCALYGIVAGCFGMMVVFGGGVRNLARMVSDGDLDSFLTQPKNLLVHVTGSHSFASGWGDIVTGIILISLSGYLTWSLIPFLFILILCSVIVVISMAIVFNSLAFWFDSMEALAKQLFDFVILFSVYPQNIYSGVIKVLLFTALPAGFVGYIPVQFLRSPSILNLFLAIGGATVFLCVALLVFNTGLKRYESGNRFGVRA